jgi:DNA-binding CsgD family transcriptional regulator
VSWRSRDPAPGDSTETRLDLTILQLVSEGSSTAAIAKLVHLSPDTVAHRIGRLMRRLRAQNRAQLVACAIEGGFLLIDEGSGTGAPGNLAPATPERLHLGQHRSNLPYGVGQVSRLRSMRAAASGASVVARMDVGPPTYSRRLAEVKEGNTENSVSERASADQRKSS